MANRLNVANIGYDDNTDALTIDASGNVSVTGNFTSTGIDDNATGSNKAVTINSSNQVSIGKRSVYGENADFNDINGTRSDIATTVTSGNNLQSETALVVVGGLYNQAGTNRTSVDIHHQGKDSGKGIGWRLESRADSNSVATDNSEFAIRKVNLTGSPGSLSTTYSDALKIDASGTVTAGTLGSGVTFPAGNCIAIHTATSSSSQSTTSGDNTLTFGTITTNKNNSKIVCAVSTRIYKVAGSVDVVIFTGTGITSLTSHYMKLQNNVEGYSTGYFTGTMNSTTTLTVQARVLHDFYSGGTGTVTVGEGGTNNTFITVWEFMP